MSSSGKVTFDVVAADDATEIFLIDGDFRLVDKGIGKAMFSAPPGIYKIKVRSGSTVVETLLAVYPLMAPVRLDPVKFVSAAPLAETAKTHEYHEAAASAAAGHQDESGSSILIVARAWTGTAPRFETPPPNPARGLSLRRLDGTTIADVAERGRFAWDPNQDPIVTLRLDVEPGAYRLALSRGEARPIEQIVVASAGWQTQVFLLADRSGQADLVNAAITIRRDFTPADDDLRLEEIARAALRDNRKVLSDALRARIVEPSAPPMLALLGALLLIRESKSSKEEKEDSGETAGWVDNRAAVATIVENLRAALGRKAHPDVEAIAIGAGVPDPTYVCNAPPMFSGSWRLMLKASVATPSLVPPGSFAARVAARTWGDGPWLLYFDPETTDAGRTAAWQRTAAEMLATIAKEEPAPATPSMFTKLTAFLTPRVRRAFPDIAELMKNRPAESAVPAIDVAKIREHLDDATRKMLVKRCGVPMASLEAWLSSMR
jgi:hypothetical protein